MTLRISEESGIGLVELLIAMTVMAIGIFALVAGFSSGFGAINRAGKTSTAGAIADKRMEGYRSGTYAALVALNPPVPLNPPKTITDPSETGPDGRSYSLDSTFRYICVLGTMPDTSVNPPTCPDSAGVKSKVAMLITLTVREGTALLIQQSSTFHQATG